jgi:hypothetical protein
MRIRTSVILLAALWAVVPMAAAQQSQSFTLEEHVFNGGGLPTEEGQVAASASFQLTSVSIGEAVARAELSSASFGMTAGFGNTYPPPGEVLGLRFADETTLTWQGERSAGTYNLYRDTVSALTGLGYGQCHEQDLDTNTTSDTEAAPAGDGFFYLVTAENRLAEEGTKGTQSDGAERDGNACP